LEILLFFPLFSLHARSLFSQSPSSFNPAPSFLRWEEEKERREAEDRRRKRKGEEEEEEKDKRISDFFSCWV
jgi:hypothetical protein